MADLVFNKFKQALGGGSFGSTPSALQQILIWDSDVSGASTVKMMLISGNLAGVSNAVDLDNVTAILAEAGISEYSGSYTRASVTSRQVTVNDTNNRSEFDAADITFSALPAGSANCDGLLVYWQVGNTAGDADNTPLIYFDLLGATASFMGNGGDVTIQFNANGVVQVT